MVELLPVNRLDIKEKMEKRSGIMRYKISQKDYDKIEELVKCALSAYNKAEAKNYIQQISYVPYNLAGAANNILGELISAIETASGQVQDKERLKYFAEISLYKLKSFIE